MIKDSLHTFMSNVFSLFELGLIADHYQLRSELPAASPTEVAHELLSCLERRQLLDRAFFQLLVELRPQRSGEIHTLLADRVARGQLAGTATLATADFEGLRGLSWEIERTTPLRRLLRDRMLERVLRPVRPVLLRLAGGDGVPQRGLRRRSAEVMAVFTPDDGQDRDPRTSVQLLEAIERTSDLRRKLRDAILASLAEGWLVALCELASRAMEGNSPAFVSKAKSALAPTGTSDLELVLAQCAPKGLSQSEEAYYYQLYFDWCRENTESLRLVRLFLAAQEQRAALEPLYQLHVQARRRGVRAGWLSDPPLGLPSAVYQERHVGLVIFVSPTRPWMMTHAFDEGQFRFAAFHDPEIVREGIFMYWDMLSPVSNEEITAEDRGTLREQLRVSMGIDLAPASG